MENLIQLLAERNVEAETGYRYRIVEGSKERFNFHYHNYYEFFLTFSDKIVHYVNGQSINLPNNSLVFIRPTDSHLFQYRGDDFCFCNVAFDVETYELLKAYIDDERMNTLESSELPVVLTLNEEDVKWIRRKFSKLNEFSIEEYDKRRLWFRALLLQIFFRYFLNEEIAIDEKEQDVPAWLRNFKFKLRDKDIFSLSYTEICAIVDRNQDYLCRNFKKYYHMTLTSYISSLRLNYAANLLVTSNNKIIDIFCECGYSNISWANALFKEKYGMTPKEYRRLNAD